MPTEPELAAATDARVNNEQESFLPGVLAVAGLRKSYGSVQAVRDVSFTVRPGEIVALLGPNGPARPPRWRSWRDSGPVMAARPKFSALTRATGPEVASCASGPGWSCRTSRSSRT
jgi:hypothetical protein